MVTRIQTMAFQGINTVPIDVQVQVANGLPAFNIVGLADKAVAESKERVRAALNASGLSLPPKRIVVNLAPADLPKEGSHYDLPIALGLMAAIGAISPRHGQWLSRRRGIGAGWAHLPRCWRAANGHRRAKHGTGPDLPQSRRARGGMGGRRTGYRRAGELVGPDQSFEGHANVRAAPTEAPRIGRRPSRYGGY